MPETNSRPAEPDLADDCSRCAALCCVSLAFDESEMFAIDKPSGTPCVHLGRSHECTIHDRREALGFKGCTRYTCHGAGQRVTVEIFDGRSWKNDRSLLEPMMDAFRQMRLVHELALLMNEAGKLPLMGNERRMHQRLSSELRPDAGWSRTSLAAFESGPVPTRIRAFLRGLQTVAMRSRAEAAPDRS